MLSILSNNISQRNKYYFGFVKLNNARNVYKLSFTGALVVIMWVSLIGTILAQAAPSATSTPSDEVLIPSYENGFNVSKLPSRLLAPSNINSALGSVVPVGIGENIELKSNSFSIASSNSGITPRISSKSSSSTKGASSNKSYFTGFIRSNNTTIATPIVRLINFLPTKKSNKN